MAGDQTVRVGLPTHEALAMLPVPDHLTTPQMDGHVCVYDNEALSNDTAVDLGQRQQDGRTVFARASRRCASTAAVGVLFDHTTGADACTVCQTAPCDTASALNRVIRMGAR